MQLKKQFRPVPYTVSGVKFQITPFAAMDSIAVFGSLTAIIVPVLKLFVPAMSQYIDSEKAKGKKSGCSEKGNGKKTDCFVDVNAIASNITADDIASAINGLSGQQLVMLFKELLIDYDNVVFVDDDEPDPQMRYKHLDLDSFNEIFCQNLGAAVSLCVKVINMNYSNFFDGLGIPSGALRGLLNTETTNTTVSSM